MYLREERVKGVPRSRARIDDFLKEKNRGLKDYIRETRETAKEIAVDEADMETDYEDEQEVIGYVLDDSDYDQDEEDMREAEDDDNEDLE